MIYKGHFILKGTLNPKEHTFPLSCYAINLDRVGVRFKEETDITNNIMSPTRASV